MGNKKKDKKARTKDSKQKEPQQKKKLKKQKKEKSLEVPCCTGCKKRCPITALSCKKGRKLMLP